MLPIFHGSTHDFFGINAESYANFTHLGYQSITYGCGVIVYMVSLCFFASLRILLTSLILYMRRMVIDDPNMIAMIGPEGPGFTMLAGRRATQ